MTLQRIRPAVYQIALAGVNALLLDSDSDGLTLVDTGVPGRSIGSPTTFLVAGGFGHSPLEPRDTAHTRKSMDGKTHPRRVREHILRRNDGPLLILASSALIALAACVTDADAPLAPLGYTVRDSAGVTIVENTSAAWAEGEGWRISPLPLQTIGVMDGPEEYIFFRARMAMRLDDGRLFVTNAGTHELRFYDSQGTFLHASGADGEGPGEFRSLGFTWVSDADSLFIYDNGLRRFSVFDQNGVFGRTFLVGEATGEFAYPDGVFGDGTVLASVDEQDQGEYSDLGVVRGRSRYNRYDGNGERMASLASLPGSELYKGTHPDGSGFTTSADHSARPFAHAGGATWFYGAGEAFEFQERGQDGGLLKLIRMDGNRRPMPQAVRDAREVRLGRMNPQAAAFWRNIPVPDSLPTHTRLEQDTAGNLWVRAYGVLDEDPYWSIFDPEGRWLGDIHTPARLRVTDIGDDYLMGVWSDTLGVQQVRIYGLEKAGTS